MAESGVDKTQHPFAANNPSPPKKKGTRNVPTQTLKSTKHFVVKFRKHRAFSTTDPGPHLKPIESESPGWLPGNVEFGNQPPVILEHRLLGVPAQLPASLSPACERKPVPQSQNLHFSPKAAGFRR